MEEKHECSGDCGNCETAWSKDLERKVVIPEVDSDPYEWEKDRIFPKKSQYPPQVLEIPADFDYEKSCSKVDDDEHRRAVERGYITGGHPMFHQLLEKMREIHNAKNADYGDGKHKRFDAVIVNRGSITTTCVPSSFASMIFRIFCKGIDSPGLVPQTTSNSCHIRCQKLPCK